MIRLFAFASALLFISLAAFADEPAPTAKKAEPAADAKKTEAAPVAKKLSEKVARTVNKEAIDVQKKVDDAEKAKK